ncbi:polyprotein [Phytophthora megakarya]|uniref:Polyprotein n=1 Tax=Phytophthora megakarya TaxID=4795 RepID=A0A225WV76_9STRA|nr:polyprotein [Phytophthora megakarya]
MIQRIFSDQSSFCRAYFDAIFIYTKTKSLDNHLAALDKVLKRCEERQLYIKFSKCTFCASEIPCLGDYFGRDGIRMDPDKVRVTREWPQPRTKRELQFFIGTCVYVLKYCVNFAELAAPLMDAIRGRRENEVVLLSAEKIRSFDEFKQRRSEVPMLFHPDSERQFHIDDKGEERVIGYGGLSITEQMYPTREKELLAALHAMRMWRVYISSNLFSSIPITKLYKVSSSRRLARNVSADG